MVDLSDLLQGLGKDSIAFRKVAQLVASSSVPLVLQSVADQSVVVEQVELKSSGVFLAIDDRVSESDTCQLLVDLGVGVVEDDSNERWNVNSCVRFSRQPGWGSNVLRELLQPLLQKDKVVMRRDGIT